MEQTLFPWLTKISHAVFSEDRIYRYELYRSLDGLAWNAPRAETARTLCFVMLNPSDADEDDNDPTIDKLTKYGRAWGFDRLIVVNLFAYCETDSRKLRSLASRTDIIGPDNDRHILAAAREAHQVVCAWGKEGNINGRDVVVRELLRARLGGEKLYCFRKNLDGSPVHPLYQRDAAVLVEY